MKMQNLLRRLGGALVAIGMLLCSAGLAFAQTSCTQFGPYPFVPNGCVNAQDLNSALNLSPSPLPPQNNIGQGAAQYKFWADTSTNPTTLRQCMVSTGCSTSYVPAQWATWGTINPSTGSIVLVGTGGGSFSLQVRKVSSGTSDQMQAADGVVEWTSATASPKSEALPVCNGAVKGVRHGVADGQGNAAAYPITLTAAGGNTINSQLTTKLNVNNAVVEFYCDGASNWVLYASYNTVSARNLGLSYSVSPGTSIQTQLTNAASNGGGTVYVQSGTYTISTPLIMSSSTRLTCERGATIVANGSGWPAPPVLKAAIININHGDGNTQLNYPVVDHDLIVDHCNFSVAGSFIGHGGYHAIEFRKSTHIRVYDNDCHSGGDCTAMLADTDYVIENNNQGTVTSGQTHGNTTLDNLVSTDKVIVGDTVDGPCIAASTTVSSFTPPSGGTLGSAVLSQAATCSTASTAVSGTTTASSTAVAVTSAGLQVGEYVTGTGIPGSDIIIAIPDGSHVTLAQPAVASGTVTLTFAGARVIFGASTNACYDQWEGPRDFVNRDNTCGTRDYGILVTGVATVGSETMARNGMVSSNHIYFSSSANLGGEAIWLQSGGSGSGTTGVIASDNVIDGDGVSNFGCGRIGDLSPPVAGSANIARHNVCRNTGTNSEGWQAENIGGLLDGNVYENVQVQAGNVAIEQLLGPGSRSVNGHQIGIGTYPSAVWLGGSNNQAINFLADAAGTGAKYNTSGATNPLICDITQSSSCKPTQSVLTGNGTIAKALGATFLDLEMWGQGGYGGAGIACGAGASCGGGAGGGGGDHVRYLHLPWPIGGATSCTATVPGARAYGAASTLTTVVCGTVTFSASVAGVGQDAASAAATGGGGGGGIFGGTDGSGGTGGTGGNAGAGTGQSGTTGSNASRASSDQGGSGGAGSSNIGASARGGDGPSPTGGGSAGGCNAGSTAVGSTGGNGVIGVSATGGNGLSVNGASGTGGGGAPSVSGSTNAANGGAGGLPGGGGGGGGSTCNAGTGTVGNGGAGGGGMVIATQQ